MGFSEISPQPPVSPDMAGKSTKEIEVFRGKMTDLFFDSIRELDVDPTQLVSRSWVQPAVFPVKNSNNLTDEIHDHSVEYSLVSSLHLLDGI